MRSEVLKELDFLLIEVGERDPWAYTRYHCGANSTLYSTVRWPSIA